MRCLWIWSMPSYFRVLFCFVFYNWNLSVSKRQDQDLMGRSWKMSTILTDKCWKVNKPAPLGQLYCDFRRAETYYSTANLQLLTWTSGWETKITSHTKVKDSGFSFLFLLFNEMSFYDRRGLVKMKLGRSGQQTFSGITDSWQSIKGYNYS